MYRIEYLEQVRKDLKPISKSDKEKIRSAIEGKLSSNPIELGKPLQYSLKGLRRRRVGDYRIIFQIDQSNKIVLVIKIGHRREIYEP